MPRKNQQNTPEIAKADLRIDKAAPTEFQKNQEEFKAVQETITSHVVGILTHEGQNVGTGTLIQFGKKRLILTADHVLDGMLVSNMRFAFRTNGSLQYAPLRQFGPLPTPLLAGKTINPLRLVRDIEGDLTGIVLRPDYTLSGAAAFYDATRLMDFAIPEEASLLFTGFPMANAVQTSPRVETVGLVAELSQYDTALNASPEVIADLDPTRQFAMKYTWADDLPPNGFSGAAVWCGRNSPSLVWTPSLVLAGVVTDYNRKKKLIYAATLGRALALFARRK